MMEFEMDQISRNTLLTNQSPRCNTMEDKLDTIHPNDIEAYHDIFQKQLEQAQEKKPTITFIGDSGVGKSSIIKALFEIYEEEEKETKGLVISNGEVGTVKSTMFEGKYLNCLDIAGRYKYDGKKDQGMEQFAQRVLKDIQNKRVEVFILVVSALDDRWKDCDKYYSEVMKLIMKKHDPRPILVLINQIDRSNDMSFLKHDRRFLIENHYKSWTQMLPGIGMMFNYLTSKETCLFSGVFLVASAPEVSLTLCCPYEPVSLDAFACNNDHHQVHDFSKIKDTLPKGKGLICIKCQKYFLVDGFEKTKSFSEVQPTLIDKNYTEDVEKRLKAKPVGLDPTEPCLSTIFEVASVHFVSSFIRQRFKQVDDRAANTQALILKIVKGASMINASEVDSQLCSEIAKVFDFPKTGSLHKKVESNRWVTYQATLFEKLRHMCGIGDEATQNYLIAWGIFYVLKYSALMQPLLTPDLSLDEKAKRCTVVIREIQGPKSGLEIVRTICKKVASSKINAFKFYLSDVKKFWPKEK